MTRSPNPDRQCHSERSEESSRPTQCVERCLGEWLRHSRQQADGLQSRVFQSSKVLHGSFQRAQHAAPLHVGWIRWGAGDDVISLLERGDCFAHRAKDIAGKFPRD
jgi:hypothetical protein